jgi:spore maturation protein CgeB
MKLLKITTLYSSYIHKFYNRHPDLKISNYSVQKARIEYDAFGWADFWGNALKPLGYDVFEVSANVEALQKTWANENAFRYGDNWFLEIVLEQAKRFKPDVLFLEDYSNFSAEWIREVRAICPSIRLTLGWCGAPFDSPEVFSAYDVILSNIPELVKYFKNAGHECHQMSHAFDSRILERLEENNATPIDPLTFVGQITTGRLQHLRRLELLKYLAPLYPLKIYSSLGDASLFDELKVLGKQGVYAAVQAAQRLHVPNFILENIPVLSKATRWKAMPLCPTVRSLKGKLEPSVYGLDMFRTLRRSAVTLNNHIDLSEASASNMRLFEATGVGACLLTDWKSNLVDFFDLEREVVTYKSPGECAEKIDWLLKNPDKAAEIGRSGQKRTLRDHSFKNRAVILDKIIRQYLR